MAPSFIPSGSPTIFGSSDRTPSTTSMVLALPCLSTGMKTERWPSMRTTFCWIWAASSARPTSRTRTGAWPSPTLTGTSSIRAGSSIMLLVVMK